MYLVVCSRLDILHVINVVSKYITDPIEEHWNAVTWIVGILVGSCDLEILFDRERVC